MATYEESLELSGQALEIAVNAILNKEYPNPLIRRWTRDPRAILIHVEDVCLFEQSIGNRPCTFSITFHGYERWEATIDGDGWQCQAPGKTLAEALCRAFIQEQEEDDA